MSKSALAVALLICTSTSAALPRIGFAQAEPPAEGAVTPDESEFVEAADDTETRPGPDAPQQEQEPAADYDESANPYATPASESPENNSQWDATPAAEEAYAPYGDDPSEDTQPPASPASAPPPLPPTQTAPAATTTSAESAQLSATLPLSLGPEGERATMDHSVSLLGQVSFRYPGAGLGLGAYYQKTLLQQGAIRDAGALHDEIGIEAGLIIRHHSWNTDIVDVEQQSWSYTDVTLTVAGLWNVWLTGELAVYPKLGLCYGFSPAPADGAYPESIFGGLVGILGLGAVYQVGPVRLRGEVHGEAAYLGLALGASLAF